MLYQDRSKRTDTHRRNEYHPSRLLIQTQHLHNNICVCAALFKCSLPPLPQVLFRYTHTHTHTWLPSLTLSLNMQPITSQTYKAKDTQLQVQQPQGILGYKPSDENKTQDVSRSAHSSMCALTRPDSDFTHTNLKQGGFQAFQLTFYFTQSYFIKWVLTNH